MNRCLVSSTLAAAAFLALSSAPEPARADTPGPSRDAGGAAAPVDEANPGAFAVAGPRKFGFRAADDRSRLFVHGLIQADLP